MRKCSLPLVLLLSACAVGPDYSKPVFQLPEHWPWSQEPTAKPAEMPNDWWTLFSDDALNQLETEGLKTNDNLALAAARVAEARAVLGLSDAALYPTLNLQGTATRTSRSREAVISPGFAPLSKPYNNFGISAVLNYELDLWGRLRRADESARAQLLSAQANQDAVRLAIAADIASGYFNLRTLDAQIEVTANTIASRENSYKYYKAQYEHGLVNGLIFAQAEAELAAARAVIPTLQQARAQQETALSLLLGRDPQAMVELPIARGGKLDALPTVPLTPANVPSSLLERRPDIRAAEETLVATNAEIGVAKADYFPTLSLTALLGLSSSESDRLLRSSARNWDIGANLTAPIVDFGRTTTNVEGATARKDQALAQYKQTVRTAFKDTLDAMSAERAAAERVEIQTQQTNARTEALRLATLRYDAGYSPFLDLLDAQRNLYQTQLDRLTAHRDRLVAEVAVFKALGGGWKQPTK